MGGGGSLDRLASWTSHHRTHMLDSPSTTRGMESEEADAAYHQHTYTRRERTIRDTTNRGAALQGSYTLSLVPRPFRPIHSTC